MRSNSAMAAGPSGVSRQKKKKWKTASSARQAQANSRRAAKQKQGISKAVTRIRNATKV